MSEEEREGYYQDKQGNWLKDRRKHPDRRLADAQQHHHEERRQLARRKSDALLRNDHRVMIEEALEDFAEEHEGHT